MSRLRNGIAVGFDHAMDRLSGAYKRKLKLVTFGVGALLALALNVDTVRIANVLWHDSALRQEMISLAPSLRVVDPTQVAGADPQLRLAGLRTLEESLRPLPLGWQQEAGRHFDAVAVLYKAAGLLLTTLAISLGASFWFDALSKLVNLRGTGPKPERTAQ
jgi:hypothetical protein